MKKLDLSIYGITGTTEILHNPSYEDLFLAETDPSLTGFEKGQTTELGAVNVMTGIYTGRSPKDKFIVNSLASGKQELRLKLNPEPKTDKNVITKSKEAAK